MTVIAWRAGVMACDSCWSYGDTQVASLIKIKRLSSGALLGQSGDNDARAMEHLLDKIKDPKKLPTRDELAKTLVDFMGLLALPKGGVFVISSGPVDQAGWPTDKGDVGVWPATSMGGYAAVGAGSDHALAAMDAGATAKEAVVIACRRNLSCRAPVHAIKLAAKPMNGTVKKKKN
jgi:ATP-dependent protease HslVU (ClpYQ) peptidase subunit